MARLDDLKAEATELGIEFKSKATIADLEALIADKKAEGNVTDQEGAERLEALKAKATDLKIDFEDDVKAEELEEFIKDVEAMRAKANEEAEAKAKAEAEAKAKAEAEAPKINKDGFEVGKELSPQEYAKYMAEQKKKAKK